MTIQPTSCEEAKTPWAFTSVSPPPPPPPPSPVPSYWWLWLLFLLLLVVGAMIYKKYKNIVK
jgi:MYXO-CTERM domain-containing protein